MILAKKPVNEKERLSDLLSLNLSADSKKDQFSKIVMILAECLHVPMAYVSSIESEKQKIQSSCGLSFDESDRSTSFCGHTILQKKPLIVEDTLKDERFFDNPMVVSGPKIRFYAGFPLVSMLGYQIGALCIADTVPRKLSEKQLEIFETIGNLLVQRIRMFKLDSIQEQIKTSQKKLSELNDELNQKNKYFKSLFGQYMSESLLNSLPNDKKATELGGEERYATVLISDLRGFTRLSEEHKPKVIVNIINLYLDKMISIIQNHDGYINEILGDGILVVFGAPNRLHNCAGKAVKCALEMQEAMAGINQELQSKNLPPLYMGIGINTGPLIAGNIGSKKRMKYGVVGNTVNVAARIESLTLPGQILLSEVTFSKVKDWVKPIGQIRVKVKGVEGPITIHDVSTIE